MKNKGFTLIELLVVVAIIGILAAVGVVAYSGYTAGAKKAATKSQHKTVVKFMQSEIMKCSLGSKPDLNGAFVECNELNDVNHVAVSFFRHFDNNFKDYKEWENPFEKGTVGIGYNSNANCPSNTLGHTSFAPVSKQIMVITRYGTGNSDCLISYVDSE